jgi:hypothetical protein
MRTSTHLTTRRSGVSLLEVTFSIGVVMVGLLGVASLLPLAGYQANKGRLADKAAHFGRQAYREFVVRGMGQGNAVWALTDGSLFDRNATGTLINPVGSAPQPYLPAPNDPTSPGPPYFFPRSFCLDPRFVSRNGFTINSPLPGNDARRFPYVPMRASQVPNSGPNAWFYPGYWMHRISLAGFFATPLPSVLNETLADNVFVAQDDLAFELPSDRTIGPVQQVIDGKRQSAGSVSWMATLVPKLDRNGGISDMYTLSIVVCDRRDPTMAMDRDNERVAIVPTAADFWSGGIGGGDVRLAARIGDPLERQIADLDVREGQWVMLSGAVNTNTPGILTIMHKWYRVVAADSEVDINPHPTTNTAWKNVTLSGPDWPVRTTANQGGVINTQVTIVPGVVAVFEKTIRLENSSLWTN